MNLHKDMLKKESGQKVERPSFTRENRPPFHVDETLKKAAKRAKAAFDEEERESRKALMNEWVKQNAQTA